MKTKHLDYLQGQYDLFRKSARKTIYDKALFEDKKFLKAHHRICRRIRFASGGWL